MLRVVLKNAMLQKPKKSYCYSNFSYTYDQAIKMAVLGTICQCYEVRHHSMCSELCISVLAVLVQTHQPPDKWAAWLHLHLFTYSVQQILLNT